MDRIEKAAELIEQAQKLGLRMEFQDGLNVLKVPAAADPSVTALMLEQLAKYLPRIRELARQRAVAALAKKLIGARIFSREHGAGTLIDASDDGALTVSVSAEVRKSDEDEARRSQMSISAGAESFIIVEEVSENGSDVDAAKPEAENKRTGVFEFLRRRSDGRGTI